MSAVRWLDRRPYRALRLLAVMIPTYLAIAPAPAAAEIAKGDGFEIHYTPSDTLTAKDIDAAKAEVQDAIRRLTEFFGHPIPGTVRIEVLKSGRFPKVYLKDGKSSYAGRITYPESRIRAANRFRDPSFVHDMSILFEHAAKEEQKGLLTIGLATYLQSKFMPQKNVYPTEGKPLHAQTLQIMDKAEWVIPLAEATDIRRGAEKTNNRHMTRIDRQLAMLEEGSFVGFLVDRYGKEKFLKHYRGEAFHTAFGVEVCDVERAWLTKIRNLNPAVANPLVSNAFPDCGAGK